jgi:tellurite resistance protein
MLYFLRLKAGLIAALKKDKNDNLKIAQDIAMADEEIQIQEKKLLTKIESLLSA